MSPVDMKGRTIVQVPIIQAAAGNFDIAAAPGVGLKIYVVQFTLIANGAGTLKFQENGATDLTGNMSLAANGGIVELGEGEKVVLQTLTANVKLNLVTGGSFVNGWARYFIDS